MLQKFRRNSRQLFDSGGGRRNSSLATISSDLKPTTPILTVRKLTFFDLPAEIRNVIYEEVASESKLCLHSPAKTKKPSKQPPPTPSLLLVSRQTKHEFLPLLLEFAQITVVVMEYDFRNLTRIISSLYSSELRALRANPHLTIALHGQRCTKDTLVSLRRWLSARSSNLDRLPFAYTISWPKHTQIPPTSTPVRLINQYIQRRAVLNQNLEHLAQLHVNVEEGLRFELGPVIAAFESEVQRLTLQGGGLVGGITGVQDRWQAAPGMQTGVRMWNYF